MPLLARVRRAAPFVVVLAVSVWLWTVADSLAINTRLDRAGPELWPKMVLLLMLGAAAWGAAEALLRSRAEEPESNPLVDRAARSAGHSSTEDLVEAPAEDRPIFAFAGIAAMLGYVAALPYVGFLLATFVLLLAIMLLAGYRRVPIAGLVAFLGTLAFFFVFQRVAYISLPLGVEPFRSLSTTMMAVMGCGSEIWKLFSTSRTEWLPCCSRSTFFSSSSAWCSVSSLPCCPV
jgi:putative tricarboxylic transport membrane protein